MNLPDDVLATADDLSPIYRRFLEYVRENPANRHPAVFSTSGATTLARDAARDFQYPLQTWPVLIGPEKLRQLERTACGVVALLKDIPRRFFNNEPKRVSAFYGLDDEARAALLLSAPDGLAGAVARCDLIDTEKGPRCIEVNLTANLGGWQLRLWKDVCHRHPSNLRFFEREGVTPFYRDPLEELFSHLIEDAEKNHHSVDGELNVVCAFPRDSVDLIRDLGSHLNNLYDAALEKHGRSFRGRVFLFYYPGKPLTQRGLELHHEGARIHAWLNLTFAEPPLEVFRSAKGRAVALYNSPLATLLGDKVNLALLSEHGESELFDDDERALIRDHLPWSRRVRAGATTFQGETVDLFELALKHRTELVLKRGSSAGGEAVYLGRHTSREEWEARLERAMGEGGWLLQEHVESRPYLFQQGDDGCSVQTSFGVFFVSVSARPAGSCAWSIETMPAVAASSAPPVARARVSSSRSECPYRLTGGCYRKRKGRFPGEALVLRPRRCVTLGDNQRFDVAGLAADAHETVLGQSPRSPAVVALAGERLARPSGLHRPHAASLTPGALLGGKQHVVGDVEWGAHPFDDSASQHGPGRLEWEEEIEPRARRRLRVLCGLDLSSMLDSLGSRNPE
ncbi:MAG: hypothetical protein HC897_09060 [Thermoanaerobaculia bacterium]|nr:hypothetical protein [Thermoanaerobaculia bacterium]